MPKLLKHLFGYMPVNLVNGLVGFGSVFIFTRLLGGEAYGHYALALSTLHLIHTLTLTWCEAAGYRFTAQAEAEGKTTDHFSLSLRLAGVSLVPSLLVLAIVWFLLRGIPDLQGAVAWLLVLLPASVICNLALESHKASQRVTRYSAVEVGRTLSGFVLGVGLALMGGFGASAPLIGMAVAFAIAAISEGLWLWSQSRGGRPTTASAKRYLAYGAPVAGALVLDLLLSASDRFLIAYFINAEAVGAYAAGYGVADKTILMLCAWAAMAGAPLVLSAFEKDGKSAAEVAAIGLARTIILVALPAAIGIMLTARPLAEVMIGEDLRTQAIDIIPWIAAAGFLNGLLIHYFSEAFQLAKKTGERALIMLIPTITNIGLNIVLLPQLGLMGAVYATVGCYALAVVLLAGFGRRHIRLPIPLVDLVKVLVACLAMAGAVSLVPDWGGFIELVLKAGVGAVVYAAVVVSLDAADARQYARDFAGKVGNRLRPQPEN